MELNGIWLLFTYLANYTEIGKLLPLSPFQRWFANWEGWDVISKYLGWFNWFVPVSIILDIMSAWLIAIAGFYAVQAILRWVKMIGD